MLLLTTARGAIARAIARPMVRLQQSGGQVTDALTQAIDDGACRGLAAAMKRALEAR